MIAPDPTSRTSSPSLGERVMSLKLPREIGAARGFRPTRWIVAAAIIAVIGYGVVKLGLWDRLRGAGKVAPQPAAVAEPPPIDEGLVHRAKGYIVPAHQILVSPKVQGMVLELKIVEGQRVNENDILAEIEKTEFEQDLRRATAMYELAKARHDELKNGNRREEIDQAQAELDTATAEFKDLERVFVRNSALWQTKSITEQELQKSEAQYLAMQKRIIGLTAAHKLMQAGARQERIAAAAAEEAQAKAEMDKAAWRLGNCTIRAPISGTILKKNAERGNIVNPLAFNGSFSLCEMADLAELEVDLAVAERDVANIFPRQRCRVRSQAYPDRYYDGYVARLMPIADRAKAAVPVRVKITVPPEEEGKYLKPEMGAEVSFYKDAI